MVQGRASGLSISQFVEDQLKEVEQKFLNKMAQAIVERSPVWSGDYVLGHSIEGRSAQGQFTSNFEGWKPKASNPGEIKSQALSNLETSIAALSAGSTAFVNRVPHAYIVEKGGWSNGKPPYEVYSGAASIAGRILQEAIAEVGKLIIILSEPPWTLNLLL